MDPVLQKLQQTIDDLIGVQMGIMSASDLLGLSNEQLEAFCDATPNGEELWDKFKARRDSKETPDNYDFKNFMVEILAETKCPVEA